MLNGQENSRFNYIDSFVQAAFQVIEMMVNSEIEVNDPFFNHDPLHKYEVIIFITVRGDVEGKVFAGMDEKTAQNLTASLLNMDDTPALDKMGRSAISEFTNVIIGNATTLLSEAGYNCLISPPAFLIMSGEAPVVLQGLETTLVIPLVTEFGEMEINIALQKNA